MRLSGLNNSKKDQGTNIVDYLCEKIKDNYELNRNEYINRQERITMSITGNDKISGRSLLK